MNPSDIDTLFKILEAQYSAMDRICTSIGSLDDTLRDLTHAAERIKESIDFIKD